MIRRAAKTALLGLRKATGIFTRLDREVVARVYLKGEGIEIGALHNPLRVPPGARVRYVDRMTNEDLRAQYPELGAERLVPVDVIDNGELLASITDLSQDFVIANHFLEHCENPILALTNMMRVLKGGGVLYLGIPDKRFTFDSGREVTPLEHCLKDYREGLAGSREGHFREWAEKVENLNDPAAAGARVRELMEMNYSIHYHVWTQTEMLKLLMGAREAAGLAFDIEVMLAGNGEVIFVLRKAGACLEC